MFPEALAPSDNGIATEDDDKRAERELDVSAEHSGTGTDQLTGALSKVTALGKSCPLATEVSEYPWNREETSEMNNESRKRRGKVKRNSQKIQYYRSDESSDKSETSEEELSLDEREIGPEDYTSVWNCSLGGLPRTILRYMTETPDNEENLRVGAEVQELNNAPVVDLDEEIDEEQDEISAPELTYLPPPRYAANGILAALTIFPTAAKRSKGEFHFTAGGVTLATDNRYGVPVYYHGDAEIRLTKPEGLYIPVPKRSRTYEMRKRLFGMGEFARRTHQVVKQYDSKGTQTPEGSPLTPYTMSQEELEAILDDLTQNPMTNDEEPVRTYTIEKTAAGTVEVRPGWKFDNERERTLAQDSDSRNPEENDDAANEKSDGSAGDLQVRVTKNGSDPPPPDQAHNTDETYLSSQSQMDHMDGLGKVESMNKPMTDTPEEENGQKLDRCNIKARAKTHQTKPPSFISKNFESTNTTASSNGECVCGCQQCPRPNEPIHQPERNPVPTINIPPDRRQDVPAAQINEHPEDDFVHVPIPPINEQRPGVILASHLTKLDIEPLSPDEHYFFAYDAMLAGGDEALPQSARQGHAFVHLYSSRTGSDFQIRRPPTNRRPIPVDVPVDVCPRMVPDEDVPQPVYEDQSVHAPILNPEAPEFTPNRPPWREPSIIRDWSIADQPAMDQKPATQNPANDQKVPGEHTIVTINRIEDDKFDLPIGDLEFTPDDPTSMEYVQPGANPMNDSILNDLESSDDETCALESCKVCNKQKDISAIDGLEDMQLSDDDDGPVPVVHSRTTYKVPGRILGLFRYAQGEPQDSADKEPTNDKINTKTTPPTAKPHTSRSPDPYPPSSDNPIPSSPPGLSYPPDSESEDEEEGAYTETKAEDMNPSLEDARLKKTEDQHDRYGPEFQAALGRVQEQMDTLLPSLDDMNEEDRSWVMETMGGFGLLQVIHDLGTAKEQKQDIPLEYWRKRILKAFEEKADFWINFPLKSGERHPEFFNLQKKAETLDSLPTRKEPEPEQRTEPVTHQEYPTPPPSPGPKTPLDNEPLPLHPPTTPVDWYPDVTVPPYDPNSPVPEFEEEDPYDPETSERDPYEEIRFRVGLLETRVDESTEELNTKIKELQAQMFADGCILTELKWNTAELRKRENKLWSERKKANRRTYPQPPQHRYQTRLATADDRVNAIKKEITTLTAKTRALENKMDATKKELEEVKAKLTKVLELAPRVDDLAKLVEAHRKAQADTNSVLFSELADFKLKTFPEITRRINQHADQITNVVDHYHLLYTYAASLFYAKPTGPGANYFYNVPPTINLENKRVTAF